MLNACSVDLHGLPSTPSNAAPLVVLQNKLTNVFEILLLDVIKAIDKVNTDQISVFVAVGEAFLPGVTCVYLQENGMRFEQ